MSRSQWCKSSSIRKPALRSWPSKSDPALMSVHLATECQASPQHPEQYITAAADHQKAKAHSVGAYPLPQSTMRLAQEPIEHDYPSRLLTNPHIGERQRQCCHRSTSGMVSASEIPCRYVHAADLDQHPYPRCSGHEK